MKSIHLSHLVVIAFAIGLLLTVPTDGSAKWWDKFGEPEYGGSITWRTALLSLDLDAYTWWSGQYSWFMDKLWTPDWTLDRNIYHYSTNWIPDKYWVGYLIESWEMPDTQTIIVHIPKGIKWHDKPPVNGREFTAYDIEHHYHRLGGLGSGYSKPSPIHGSRMTIFEEITATDKYTVLFKSKNPSAHLFQTVAVEDGLNYVEAPEVVEQGLITDWKYAVGTGPWILTDFVDGSSVTYSKNPDYWGHDERYPENRVPYADKLKMLCIPDMATAMAALRSGRIDMLDGISWEQATSLARTNPDLEQAALPRGGQSAIMKVDTEPYNDIRVRKALNMAIDRKTIAKTIFGGMVEGIPCGLISPAHKEYCFPYQDWPQELKDEYSYNPERARQLLAEAGYPEGFKTNVVIGSNSELDLAQIIKAYLLDIGVDLEMKVMDPATLRNFVVARKHDQLYWNAMGSVGGTVGIPIAIGMRHSKERTNYGSVNDPGYDAIIERYRVSADPEEVRLLAIEADRYAIEHHWEVTTFPTANYVFHQPYLKGYSGEQPGQVSGWLWARFWIDQELKKTMGQ